MKLKLILNLNKEELTGENKKIDRLIAKNFYNELENGCLSITDIMREIYYIAFSLYPDAYNLSKDKELVDKCNEIAACEFVRRARLSGDNDDEQKLKNLYISFVSECQNGDDNNTPGNIFSNLMSIDYEIKGLSKAILLQLKGINGQYDLKRIIRSCQGSINYYQRRKGNTVMNSNEQNEIVQNPQPKRRARLEENLIISSITRI